MPLGMTSPPHPLHNNENVSFVNFSEVCRVLIAVCKRIELNLFKFLNPNASHRLCRAFVFSSLSCLEYEICEIFQGFEKEQYCSWSNN